MTTTNKQLTARKWIYCKKCCQARFETTKAKCCNAGWYKFERNTDGRAVAVDVVR